MKNDHQENGLLRGPLILMVPASNLVAVMSLDWLDAPAGQLYPRKRTAGIIWQLGGETRRVSWAALNERQGAG
jgi:hypothetical protein